MDPRMLDGNAIGGLLHDVFAAEMTTAIATCGTCGASEPIGALHVFRGAGIVLRCSHCESVLARFVVRGTQTCVDLGGLHTLVLTQSGGSLTS